MCLPFPTRRTAAATSLPRRKTTFRRGSAKRPMQALRKMVVMSTLIAPTQNGFHKQVGGQDGAVDGPGRRPLELKPSLERHLRHIYDLARGDAKELARAKLAAFFDKVQREEQTAPLGKETYTYGQFLETWYMLYGWDLLSAPRAEDADLSQPISNYFISSSHNTYLDGDQFFSDSTPAMYREVLEKNCRCIEIDVWNAEDAGTQTPSSRSKAPVAEHGRHKTATPIRRIDRPRGADEAATDPVDGWSARQRSAMPKDEPRVLHGWTGTKPTGFRDVCRAVRDTAFATNPLPIIVSLEVHADLDQQEVMVDIMQQEWAGLLLDRAYEDCPPVERQPRLDELLHKILIKAKKPPPRATLMATHYSHFNDDDSCSDDDRGPRRNKKVPIAKRLGDLAIYTHSARFRNFEAASSKALGHIHSISESKIRELHARNAPALLAHNRNFFMRAYPDGWRVDSSNLDPSIYWRRGVQMTALNWQSMDEGMMLNHAMFDGSLGWVLKPPGYRSDAADEAGPPSKPICLRLTILAGQHIPLPPARHASGVGLGTGGDKSFHPYVTVKLISEQIDTGPVAAVAPLEDAKGPKPVAMRDDVLKQKTKPAVTDHPDFGKDGVAIEFPELHIVEELSFLRLKIEDDSSYFRGALAAWACVRLDRVRQGYRIIDLFDSLGKTSEGKLLVHVDKKVTACFA